MAAVPFWYLTGWLEWWETRTDKKKATARDAFRQLITEVKQGSAARADDYFQLYRLLLPHLDTRRSYGLQDVALCRAVMEACGTDRQSNTGKELEQWRQRDGSQGRVELVLKDKLLHLHCRSERNKAITIGDINRGLDNLATAERRKAKKGELSPKAEAMKWLIVNLTENEMVWVLRVILKKLQNGITETQVLATLHPAALSYFNTTSDLQHVCKILNESTATVPVLGVHPGRMARSQLCRAVATPGDAAVLMHGRRFQVDAKLDGYRLQVHREGPDARPKYFTRGRFDKGAYETYRVLDSLLCDYVDNPSFMLDAEIIVWNKVLSDFEPLGIIRSTALAAQNGDRGSDPLASSTGAALLSNGGGRSAVKLEALSDEEQAAGGAAVKREEEVQWARVGKPVPLVQDLELRLCVFDVMYWAGAPVSGLELRQRQDILRTGIKPQPVAGVRCGHSRSAVTCRIMPMLPELHPELSRAGSTEADIQSMYDECLDRKWEGVVVKDLQSKWRVNDRSGAWLKMKPDYVDQRDIDALIIGVSYGFGKNAGISTEYLLAIGDKVVGGVPQLFVSFSKVATGISDRERQALHDRLKPLLEDVKGGGANMPSNYVVGTKLPSFWVRDPKLSLVLSVKADIRMVQSKVYASPWSLRFPRITAVRAPEDKDHTGILTVAELEAIAAEKAPHRGTKTAVAKKAKRAGGPRSDDLHTPASVVASTAVEYPHVLQNEKVFFANWGPEAYCAQAKAQAEVLVRKLGGQTVQNYFAPPNSRAPSIVVAGVDGSAQGRKGVKWYKAIKEGNTVDILSMEWLHACLAAGERLECPPNWKWWIADRNMKPTASHSSCGICWGAPTTAAALLAVLERHVTEPRIGAFLHRKLPAAEAAAGGSLGSNQAKQGILLQDLEEEVLDQMGPDLRGPFQGSCAHLLRLPSATEGPDLLQPTIRPSEALRRDLRAFSEGGGLKAPCFEAGAEHAQGGPRAGFPPPAALVTHLVVPEGAAPGRGIAAQALLTALVAGGCGKTELDAIRHRIEFRRTAVVSQAWLRGGNGASSSLMAHAVPVLGDDGSAADISSWPWDEVLPQQPVPTTARMAAGVPLTRKRKVAGRLAKSAGPRSLAAPESSRPKIVPKRRERAAVPVRARAAAPVKSEPASTLAAAHIIERPPEAPATEVQADRRSHARKRLKRERINLLSDTDSDTE